MPLTRPSKWPVEANRVLLVLEFFDVNQFRFLKWGRENAIELEYKKKEGLNYIAITGLDIDLSFESKWIHCKSISAYCSE